MLLNGDSGWLNSRIKNLREAKNKLIQKRHVETNENSILAEQNEIGNDEAKAIITSLKSMAVVPGKLEEISQKLAITRKYRKNLLLGNVELNLKKQFPYFFTHPEVVSIVTSNGIFNGYCKQS